MRVQLETITSQVDRSFSLMFNPRLSDLFFWHSHPKYEIVYIQGATGTRHIGDHISTYRDRDLVLIGSHIPHLNFDYGVQTEYQKVVVHLKKEFVDLHFKNTPELTDINNLFEKSMKGLAFSGEKTALIGKKLFDLEHLKPFEQYLEVLEILQLLSKIQTVEVLHKKPYHDKHRNKEQERLQSIYAFIDKNYHRKIELKEIADTCFMTKEAFCRYFKKMTTYTFTAFLNRYRVSHSKRYLMAGECVSDACFQSGFHSLSYYNRVFKIITEENPSTFRKRHLKEFHRLLND